MSPNGDQTPVVLETEFTDIDFAEHGELGREGGGVPGVHFIRAKHDFRKLVGLLFQVIILAKRWGGGNYEKGSILPVNGTGKKLIRNSMQLLSLLSLHQQKCNGIQVSLLEHTKYMHPECWVFPLQQR